MSFKFYFHNLIYATKFEHMTRGRSARLGHTQSVLAAKRAALPPRHFCGGGAAKTKHQPKIGWCFVSAPYLNLCFNLTPSLDFQLKHFIFYYLFSFFVTAYSEKLFSFFCVWKRRFIFKLKVINVFKE